MSSQGSNAGCVVNGPINLLVSRLLAAAKPVVVAPPDQAGMGNGIVIISNSNAPWQAAKALLGAIGLNNSSSQELPQ
jgi:hypothetical protein